jgi:hypothetical protein
VGTRIQVSAIVNWPSATLHDSFQERKDPNPYRGCTYHRVDYRRFLPFGHRLGLNELKIVNFKLQKGGQTVRRRAVISTLPPHQKLAPTSIHQSTIKNPQFL